MTLKERFEQDAKAGPFSVVVIAVKLPSGGTETITNYHNIDEKIEYYKSAYDDGFRLKANPYVQIVGYMLV